MTFLHATDIDPGATIEADLCIIGAGAAGIAIACALADSGLSIAMLVGGGKQFRHRDQMLYHGRNIGRESFAPGKARFRMFGGSTTRWAGQCRPLDPVDFEPRPGLPDTGWPIGAETLAPWYRAAAEVCDLDDWRFDPPALTGLNTGDGATPVRYRHGHNVDFAVSYGPRLARSNTVKVYLDTHATEIVQAGSKISHVEATGPDGRRMHFAARDYILATGGIENARLLLASTAGSPNGLANERDLVGRYFMDHPFFFGGALELAPGVRPEAVDALQGYEQAGVAQRRHGAFALGEGLRRDEGLNGAAVFFVERAAHKSSEDFLSTGGVAMTRVLDVLMHRELPDGRLGRHLPALLTHPGEVGRSTLERLRGAVSKRRTLAARFTLEALPNPESRVRLDPRRRDRFGMPHVTVDWQLTGADLGGLERLRTGLARLFADGGIGKLSLHGARDADGFPASMEGGKHHMGTTRMSADPARGVVDPDCRVHEIENLFIAGSSVFPTGGYVNPTLTIVALALRLADHLRGRAGALPGKSDQS
ncbi:FAD-dependent oxidoreductase [Tropicimonas aquimaris]|uniref:FAD-dependent oxidoreductase n=1 Tax=Tropicimonas aquimaris TaxID=914152 RepID=A0ABW3IX86_9RHOB